MFIEELTDNAVAIILSWPEYPKNVGWFVYRIQDRIYGLGEQLQYSYWELAGDHPDIKSKQVVVSTKYTDKDLIKYLSRLKKKFSL